MSTETIVETPEVFDVSVLTRDEAIKQFSDPTGKRWLVKSQRGKSLLMAQVEPFSSRTIVPDNFSGQWTSRSKLEAAITQWLGLQWDKSDKASKPLAKRAVPKTAKEVEIQAAVDAENAALAAAA